MCLTRHLSLPPARLAAALALAAGLAAPAAARPADSTADTAPQGRWSSTLLLGVGAGGANHRDAGTSPLRYSGPRAGLSAGNLYARRDAELLWRVDAHGGLALSRSPRSRYWTAVTSALEGGADARLQALFAAGAAGRWDFAAGGALLASGALRYNSSLNNNGLGIDLQASLAAAGRATIDISRPRARQAKVWFARWRLRAVRRHLSVGAEAGLLNLSARPGYAYSYFAPLSGGLTQAPRWALADYRWAANGLRLGAEASYKRFLDNGNAMAWSYRWQAATARGRAGKLEKASHTVAYTLYFDIRRPSAAQNHETTRGDE